MIQKFTDKKKEIVRDIRELYIRPSSKPFNVAREHSRLYSRARRAFGSWKKALEYWSIDYEQARNNKKWSHERVISEIRGLCSNGNKLSINRLREDGKTDLVSAAVYHFGSWSKAVRSSRNLRAGL